MKTVIYGLWHVHAEQYYRTAAEMTEVIGVYEPNTAWRDAFCAKYNLPAFTSPEEVWASGADAAIVCTATSEHTEAIIGLAKAGIAIFTEKVLALTDAECDRIEEAVKENQVTFAISLFQKYLGSRIAVKNVVDSGELGKINYMRFRNCHSGSVNNWLPAHFYNQKECGGGAMIDLGAHGMYLTEWLLGMPIGASSTFTVACDGETMREKNVDRVEDNAVTVMHFENGAIAINETGFVSRYSPVVLEVYGEDGFVRMEDDRVFKCTGATKGALTEVAVPQNQPQPIVQFLSGELLPGCSLKEAKALTRMMTMAYSI